VFVESLSLSQGLCSLVLITLFKKIGLLHYKDFNWHTFVQVLPLGGAFVLYMIFGMLAIRLVNMFVLDF
jgi:hypothetical protein